MSRLQMKWLGIGFVTLLAALALRPNYKWYKLPSDVRAKLDANKERPKRLINLGLDLMGGTHLRYELELSTAPGNTDLKDAMDRQIEVIRNRVDQYGVAEPLIARQGSRQIVVQLPGVKDPERAKELIGATAVLEFRMVDDTAAGSQVLTIAQEKGGAFNADKKVHPEILKVLPKGLTILPGKEESFFIVSTSVPLTGALMTDARVDTGGQFNYPVVAFKFNDEGGKIFDALTAANVNRRMAIALDGVVYSAPVIRSRIPGGSGIIEGNFNMEDAAHLAIVLRAGSLPVPMKIVEERTVGASLGEDSIKAGVRASMIGLGAVMLFLVFYYKASGLVAGTALVLNVLFVLAGMSLLKATLTLPGFAGIILTLGMSVDANILIFERIREELRSGKPVRIGVETGYDKAFSAILDGNLTTFFAALFLFQFGTGPIKGFAVTLILGNIISMFTAITVTKAIFETALSQTSAKELSI